MGSSGALPQGIFHGSSERGEERRWPAKPARAFRAKMEEVMTESDEATEVRTTKEKTTFETKQDLEGKQEDRRLRWRGGRGGGVHLDEPKWSSD